MGNRYYNTKCLAFASCKSSQLEFVWVSTVHYQMFTRNTTHSAIQPERSFSKKEHSQIFETEWTITVGQWWSFEKNPLLQSLQPKNSSDLHSLQSCLPHIIIFCMDSFLSNVKIPSLRLFFHFVMEKIFYDYYMLL